LFKEIDMRGSIRMIAGLIVVMGAAGGIDTATDTQLIGCIAIASVGLALMLNGVTAMNTRTYS
jgi:hypothetical protein